MEHAKQQASSKRRLKLGDIAEHLQVKKFVVRAWEKELGLAPQGGLYGAEAVELFKKIKQLVLVEHKTIAQVRDLIGAPKVETEVSTESQSVTGASVCETEYHAAMMQEEPAVVAEEVACAEVVLSEACDAVIEPVVEVAVVALEAAAIVPAVEVELVAEAAIEAAPQVVGVQADTVVAAQVLATPAQQEFLVELAFFKQELVRFQELLKA